MRIIIFLVSVFAAVNGLNNLQLKKIIVNIGAGNNDGTDDDVVIKVCDQTKCCHTKTLSHLFGSEWVKNKTEVWDGGKLGNCSQILFESGSTDLGVTLLKTRSGRPGKDDLKVSSIILEGTPTTEKTNILKFACGSFIFAGSDTSKTQRCPVRRPTTSQKTEAIQIKQVTVKIGAGNNDGTDDDVIMKICDQTKCCHTKTLSHLLGREWVKNKTEVWDGGKLGNCSQILFASGSPDLTVTLLKTRSGKAGKDDLKVSSILLEGGPPTSKTNTFKFTCGTFTFAASDISKTQRCSNGNKINNKPAKRTRPTSNKPAKRTRPTSALTPESVKIKQILVQIGIDGTNDDVKIKACSLPKTGAPVCCETETLSTILHDDWSKLDNETWSGGALGSCRSSVLMIEKSISSLDNGKIKITVNKKGKDPVKINDIVVETETIPKKTIKTFKCGPFAIDGKKNTPSFLTKTCVDSSSISASEGGSCLRNGKNCGSASASTTRPRTTRPPFRSGK